MKEEEYLEKITKEIMKSMAESLLKSKELSRELGEIKDENELRLNIDKLATELSNKFIKNLKKADLYGKDMTKSEFEDILKITVKEHLGNSK